MSLFVNVIEISLIRTHIKSGNVIWCLWISCPLRAGLAPHLTTQGFHKSPLPLTAELTVMWTHLKTFAWKSERKMLTFIQQPIFRDFSTSEKKRKKNYHFSYVHSPGRSVPELRICCHGAGMMDWFECTGSAVMDVDVYWKELDRGVKGNKKKIFLSKQKNIIFAYIIFVVCFCLITVCFVDSPEVQWIVNL